MMNSLPEGAQYAILLNSSFCGYFGGYLEDLEGLGYETCHLWGFEFLGLLGWVLGIVQHALTLYF